MNYTTATGLYRFMVFQTAGKRQTTKILDGSGNADGRRAIGHVFAVISGEGDPAVLRLRDGSLPSLGAEVKTIVINNNK